MSHSNKQDPISFSLKVRENGIAELIICSDDSNPVSFDMDYFTLVLKKLVALQTKSEITGVIIHFSGVFKQVNWLELFTKMKVKSKFSKQYSQLIKMILILQRNEKITVGIFDDVCLSYVFSCLLLCDYRIAVGNQTKIGFPETQYGLFPGLGSTVFLHQLLGAEGAFELLDKGKIYGVQASLNSGIIHQHFDVLAQGKLKAEKFILKKLKPNRIFQHKTSANEEEMIQGIRSKVNSLNPAIHFYTLVFQDIPIKTLEELLILEKLAVETVLETAAVLAVVRTLFDGVQRVKSSRIEQDIAGYSLQKIAVIGAGMMGAGIAYVAAKSGLAVDLKDANLEMSKKGKEFVRNLAIKAVQLQKITDQQKDDLLDSIEPIQRWPKQQPYDLIIEAVFEDLALKSQVMEESISFLHANGVMASNTTSLPITTLAQHLPDSSQFIGLHFFSPVDRMPLVEVILGKHTSEETLQKALKFVELLGKTPIKVNDGPAFFTSRIFFNYLLEGISMLLERIPADVIENAAKKAGYAVGPLAVLDEISLPLMIHVYHQLPALSTSQRKAGEYLEKLVQFNRLGRKAGKGFYTYQKNGMKQLWVDPDLQPVRVLPEQQSLVNRLLYVVALDAYRCLDERILMQPIDGDIGSILGIGFPKNTGGVFSLMDLVGLKDFLKACDEFQEFGEQWLIPKSLEILAKRDFKFYSEFKSNWVNDEPA